jgi:hypothetical protein
MNLGMFDIFCPSMKIREYLEEIFDLNKFDRYSERYVIPMHRNNFWTNKWMQEPRIFFCRLQFHHCDPNAQYRKGWESFKRKRGLTLCYNCRRSRHIAKECPSIGLICLCCKAIGHEVLDFHRMIAKVENMDMRKENYEEGKKTKDMLENQKRIKDSNITDEKKTEWSHGHKFTRYLKRKDVHINKNRRLRHSLYSG